MSERDGGGRHSRSLPPAEQAQEELRPVERATRRAVGQDPDNPDQPAPEAR